ncbi:ABC transporter substrate-binding protein, partial [Candidatus Poribacteria bacterium]|nr:ABC transporter substrate-binding protein [Candidatus Poribacteria bacterium]
MKVRRFTILRLLSFFVALIVGLCACDQTGQLILPGTPETEAPVDEIPVGVALSVTGRFAASSGVSIAHGLDLALEETNQSERNGRQIRFIRTDDKSTVAGAVEAYNKLIQDGVLVILGPATSSQAEAAFPVAQEHGVVAMSPTSTARGLSALGDCLFRAALATDVVIPSGIETTHAKLGYQTAATMYDDSDVFSTDSDLAVRETLAAKGVKVLITQTFRGGDTDFTAQLTRINETNPDVIFVSAQAPEKPGILTQGRQIGIPVSVPFIVRTLTTANVQAAGTAAEGAITFVGWASIANTPGNQAFVQNYTEKY